MKVLTSQQYLLRIGLCLMGLVLLLVISPGVGSAPLGLWDVWRAGLGIEIPADELIGSPFADIDGDGAVSEAEASAYVETARNIGFRQRLPRSILALIVGVTLSMCGSTFQVLFRNPLATPYTLGIASGGSLGALIAIRSGWEVSLPGVSSLSVAAFVGGIMVVSAIFLLARGARRLTSNELLLAGVTMGLFCSAMMMVVTVISSERETFRMVRWMMGSLVTISTTKSVTMLPLLVPAWAVLLLSARSLNQYRLGDELAASRGVCPVRLQRVCVIACTVATAAVVANCGPIGFVGLVVPHAMVLVVGSDCRVLLPASALAGGAFLILCDWASQLAMQVAGWATQQQLSGATLPIGVVTAVIGVPIFLVLLRTRKA